MTHRHKPLYPEPGLWVADDLKGLPVIEPPEPLPIGKLSSVDIRDEHIAYDGLGFCVYSYIPPEKIADVQLRKLWQRARRSMRDIVEYLETVDKISRNNVVLKSNSKNSNVIGERLL